MIFTLMRAHRARLSLAYLLTAAGMIAGLLYPFATGLAINGVLAETYSAVWWLVGCHAAQMALTIASKRWDTRVFTRVYGALAASVVERSRLKGMEPSRVAARVALSREYIVFLEEDAPRILYAAIALTVSLGALWLLQPMLALACLALGVPLLLVARWLDLKSSAFNLRLNNRLEHEVGLITGASSVQVARHFRAVAGWRIKLSDAEATAFGAMEMLVIALFVVALWQVGIAEQKPLAGDVFAIFSYLWRYVESLDQVPVLIQKLAKLRDLDRRMATPSP